MLSDWIIGTLAAVFVVERGTKIAANRAYLKSSREYFDTVRGLDVRDAEYVPLPPEQPRDRAEDLVVGLAHRACALGGKIIPFKLIRKQKEEKPQEQEAACG